ncbi:hypothetical protein RRU94_15815 [Domibacillus sp. DTU_2020_1001157_1_SI_ALB_TIR_016]|uniref:zinc-ribbon domain-containing protein n=1 Tax=Domibacillus sp. DTU_2020_1001157_1_SI_ALB_TIR_016 TaxID=3077789 RepID=UPI0028E3B899|nr:hypothetical protein [Domibacillus sp. DTU_2020_1001157_1_SI_ALB_TIR_016]WNS82209.1 hypothetical protein RRU94_15815 [Domibacillus sp. DTU_2020_1001157_1_SI_ALB_TIR_016]
MYENLVSTLQSKKLRLTETDCVENIHSKLKVTIECLTCHVFFNARVDHLLKGTGCAHCAGNAKLTAEEVYQKFQGRGVFLDPATYVNSYKKSSWRCRYGHQWDATPKSIQMGRNCPLCAGNQKLNYGSVKAEIEAEGNVLLSTEYVNARTPLTIQCINGHLYNMAYHNYKKGSRCKMCHNNSRKHGIEKMRNLARERGGQCLSEHYVNTKTKLKWMCRDGHIFDSRPMDVLRGKWCPVDIGVKLKKGKDK